MTKSNIIQKKNTYILKQKTPTKKLRIRKPNQKNQKKTKPIPTLNKKRANMLTSMCMQTLFHSVMLTRNFIQAPTKWIYTKSITTMIIKETSVCFVSALGQYSWWTPTI